MPDRDATEALSAQITEFFRALETRRALDAETLGLTATEYRALARVVEIGQKTPKKLATSMGMSTGAITAVTDRLVARGLLERIANPLDRRSIMLQPTEEGRKTINGLFDAYRDLIASAASESTGAEVEQLKQFLARLTAQLRP